MPELSFPAAFLLTALVLLTGAIVCTVARNMTRDLDNRRTWGFFALWAFVIGMVFILASIWTAVI